MAVLARELDMRQAREKKCYVNQVDYQWTEKAASPSE